LRRQLRVDRPDVLEPHDHVVWYGEGSDDLYELANAALDAGARRNEKLMFVAREPDADRLKDIGGLSRLLDSGQLELADIEAVYGASGDFDAATQLATFEGVLADALANGYTGIRVVADNTPLARGNDAAFHRWLRWEHMTDRFQDESNVTGICFFDRRELSAERQTDLASLHPICHAGSVKPPFSFVIDGDAVSVAGALDVWSAERLGRILDVTPEDEPLVLDLEQTEFVDHRALLALNAAASTKRPVRIRRARPIIRRLPALLGLDTPHLCFD
jgi:hypothetical protein